MILSKMKTSCSNFSNESDAQDVSRRALLAGGADSLGWLCLSGPAIALTEQQARKMVETLVDEVNAIIVSKDSEANKIRRFEQLFIKYADTDFMARYALGADGRSASAADIKAFTKAFQGYVARKYGGRFREFIGGRLEVMSAAKRKSIIEVKTKAFLQGTAPFEVTFQLSDRSGSDRFVNMFIEGVNLLLTERTEIGALLDRRGGSIRKLAEDLKTL